MFYSNLLTFILKETTFAILNCIPPPHHISSSRGYVPTYLFLERTGWLRVNDVFAAILFQKV